MSSLSAMSLTLEKPSDKIKHLFDACRAIGPQSVSAEWWAVLMTTTLSNKFSNGLGKDPSMEYKSNVRSIEHPFETSPRSTSMSTVTVEREPGLDPALLHSLPPGRTVSSPVRPGRRSGRCPSPTSRPTGAVKAPVLRQVRSRPRTCEVTGAVPQSSTWRLTDRGITMILVVATMIAMAALSVIGLTAARVTSERFHPATSIVAQS